MRRDRDGYLLPERKRRIDWGVTAFWVATSVLCIGQFGFAIYGFIVWWSGVCS